MNRRASLLPVAILVGLVAVIAAALVFFINRPSASTPQIALPDLDGRTVRVAVENTYAPFNFISAQTGEGVGWDYDAVREICTRLNCVPVFEQTIWDTLIDQVAAGEFDMSVDGLSITEERAEVVDFSIPYQRSEHLLLVRTNENRFTSAEALADLTLSGEAVVGALDSTTNYDTAVELAGVDAVQTYETVTPMIDALLAGELAAVVLDDTSAATFLDTNLDTLRQMGDPLVVDELAMIFPKSSELLEPFNQALTAMQQDGTLRDLDQRWFLSFDTSLVE